MTGSVSGNGPAIEAVGLRKRFGDKQALDDVSLHADPGTVLGVLGPNGSGKTTTVRALCTLLVPDEGTARVAGHNVIADPKAVRRHIGVTAQSATLDEQLTGRQNLTMVGELSQLGRRATAQRADELFEQFDLADAAHRPVATYSGGMRRRLDLAASIIARPPVLFLDEPTTGLDPTNRNRMWDIVRGLVDDGVTVLLTTQYLDEADALADRIVVIDAGRVIAEGTAQELKSTIGTQQVVVTLSVPEPRAADLLAPFVAGPVTVLAESGGRVVTAAFEPSPGLVTAMVRSLDDDGVSVDDIEVRRATLDDVFFALTEASP